jgi:hypothetical protein
MRRAALTLLIAGLIGIACAAIAIANKGSTRDPVGDVKHNPPGKDARYDIVKVTYGHAPNGDLVQRVKTKGKVFGFSGMSGAPPLLWIDVPGKVANRAGCKYSDYFVVPGEVDQCGDGPKTGDAQVTKLDAHTMEFRFAPAAIGNPARYGIAFVEEGSNAKGLVFFDRAPDKGFLKHKLSGTP